MSIIIKPEEQDPSEHPRYSPVGLGIFLAATVVFFLVASYFDLGDRQYEGEALITLTVKASDRPERIASTELRTEGYSLKAQEFNCQFWISGVALEVIAHHENMADLVTIKRGDDLKITIYAADEIKLNDLYHNVKVLGLMLNDKAIYTPEQLPSPDEKQQSRILIYGIVGLVILVVLFIVGLRKKSVRNASGNKV